MKRIVVLIMCATAALTLHAADTGDSARTTVLALDPVGFWPLGDGDGETVADLSSSANHGRAINVPWEAESGLLEFRNAFQYIEIPANNAYQTPSFSCGGWVFLREMPMGGNWRPRVGFQVIGHQHWQQQVGAHVSIRHHGVPAATTGDKNSPYDVLGNWDFSAKTPPVPGPGVLSLHSWQHVLFTFKADGDGGTGHGMLYLNGKQIAANDGVVYTKAKRPLVAGSNAFWWHQTVSGATGLDGSLRDLVWFDRALEGEEVVTLAEKTKPAAKPAGRGPGTVVVRTRWYELESLSELPPEVRRDVLDELVTWNREKLSRVNDELMKHLPALLSNPDTCYPSAVLLNRLDSDTAREALIKGHHECLAILENDGLSRFQRAESALSLLRMPPTVTEDAVPLLVSILRHRMTERPGTCLKVEEVLINSCLVALNHIAKDDLDARSVITALTQPLREAAGESRRFMTHRTARGGKERDYTSSMELNGVTYKVGKGIAWKGVDEVTPDQWAAIVERIPREHQDAAKAWAEGKAQHLYRVPLYRTTPDGQTQKVYLEDENFVLYGEDAKLRGWSIFADERGYIHLVGGQHNTPNSELYVPGSWEKMGLPRSRTKGPRQMYWVSREPESIDSFEFVGGRNDPRAIPMNYLNYMVFVKSFEGKNLLFGRVDHYGWQSWGAFVYNSARKRWRALGGDAYNAYEDALSTEPKWSYYAPRRTRVQGRAAQPIIRGGIPSKPTGAKALAWSWNPAFYNFCRDDWGIRFDRTGRMHVRVNLFGIEEEGFYDHRELYAYSDDMGRRFFRADGSLVKLPLTTNPAPAHNASTSRNANGQWLTLWLDVLQLAGVE